MTETPGLADVNRVVHEEVAHHGVQHLHIVQRQVVVTRVVLTWQGRTVVRRHVLLYLLRMQLK